MFQYINKFWVVGIHLRTNHNIGQLPIDLRRLWSLFIEENMFRLIPNTLSSTVYCLYTNYKSDYRSTYTVVIGVKVLDLKDVPAGMCAWEVVEGVYRKYEVQHQEPYASLKTWVDIWQEDRELNRAYTTDYESYPHALNGDFSNASIFISINN
jgi:predicted transcriptional regulator YdeE